MDRNPHPTPKSSLLRRPAAAFIRTAQRPPAILLRNSTRVVAEPSHPPNSAYDDPFSGRRQSRRLTNNPATMNRLPCVQKMIRLLLLTPFFVLAAQPQTTIHIQADAPGPPFKPIYNWFGYDEPNYTYSAH